MLDYEKTKEPNAIKEIVTDKIAKLQTRELDDAGMVFLLELLMNKEGNYKIPENEKPVLYRIIEQRVENCFTYTLNDSRLLIYLCYLSESAGNAIMYLWYLQAHCSNKETSSVNLDEFCLNVFPWGYPTKEDLQKIWDGQKVRRPENSFGSDNLIDYLSAGMSILQTANVDK